MSHGTEHRARKRFGQNFLHDKNIIEKIIFAINPSNNDNIVEIGPGQGAITNYLNDNCKSLDIIEIDRDLAAKLRDKHRNHTHITLHEADALEFDFSSLDKNFRAVGNLPYNISTPLLINFINYYDQLIDAHFMLQKELVERICAPAGNKTYGRLSVIMQYYFETEHLFNVGPHCFSPAPKVDSAIIRLRKKTPQTIAANLSTFHQVCAATFSKRRKTLRNNLKDVYAKNILDHLEDAYDLSRRAETLELNDFISLSNIISAHEKSD